MNSLRFSRRSWHYWLYSRNLFFIRGYRTGAKNLCAYFWSIVGIVVGNLLLIAVLLALLIYLGVTISAHLVILLYALGIIVGAVVFFGGVWLVGGWWDNWAEKRRGRAKVERRPNLLFEYVKAKKKKYCPLIEWAD
jgi:hypothetical protein